MKIIIIEDETLVAEDLAASLKEISSDLEIVSILGSVKEAISYFKVHPQPDLIFSDIQLGDGLSFEIVQAVPLQVPLIFCTAFDEYALDAFKANGIEYILKPFSYEALKLAVEKFKNMKKIMSHQLSLQYQTAIESLSSMQQKGSGTLMVKFRDRLLPFTFDKIALFYVENETTTMLTHSGKSYILNDSLEDLEKKTQQVFFRMNRQFLVNRNAIQDATDYFPRKLKVNLLLPFDKEIFVSREKRTKMLTWLSSSNLDQ
ncbi:LytTR family DNA-binding domain-containing protein [Flavobacterium sp. LS1R49]|uniref:LytTR family DNA-binding domain-containing protein n=1 Tax=Flavobacterium shii TaxID=2987687 RepID=A0A9X2YXT4_9FLAO|nr:LytTR family DNA-binding domain-containing protein [Flavobacterium shii]MCV9930274.1 LytTR family DNA-binding domain-containing protein [Flavobacterium shii]